MDLPEEWIEHGVARVAGHAELRALRHALRATERTR